jgi:hypothetical protein
MSQDNQQNLSSRTTHKRRRFNWLVSDLVRWWLRHWTEFSARLTGQRFYCRALAGESEYNLTINCDSTLSCSCQDYDGSGHLGDLGKATFPEVYFGPVARHFREQLAKGKLPINTCARCGDLVRVRKERAGLFEPKMVPGVQELQTADGRRQDTTGLEALGTQVYAGPEPRLPKHGMLLENTVRCNIDCIGCDRQSAARIRTSLQMDMSRLAQMGDLVAALGLEQLFYLNLGEPFLSPNIGQELPMLKAKNPDCRIVISTNGMVLNTDAKREAALSASHIFFSIAGIDDPMLKKYEKHGSFEKAYFSMKALVEFRNARGLSTPLLEWKYLLFNWNDRRASLQRAIEMARDAGVDFISFWPTNNPFYGYSWRFRLGWVNDFGVSCWKGRELDLRQPQQQPA